MKYNSSVTKSRKKNRKRYFQSSSADKRKSMISPLSKELKFKYNTSALPIRKEDEVIIMRGLFKGKNGKIIQCQRKNFKVFVDKLVKTKTNKTNAFIPISPSNIMITKLFLSKERKVYLEKKKIEKKVNAYS